MKVRKPIAWPNSVAGIRRMPRTDETFFQCLEIVQGHVIDLTEFEEKYYNAILSHQAGTLTAIA